MSAAEGVTPGIEALDHVVIAVRDLEAAAADYARLFGRPLSWRGTHPEQGTANALFRLDNTYVELLAAVGDGPLAEAVRAHLKRRKEGLMAMAFAASDIATLAAGWRQRGVDVGAVQAGRGRDDLSGAERQWRWLTLPAAATRGVFLFAIQHDSPADALPLTAHEVAPDAAPSGVDHVVVFSGDAEASRHVYGDLLGLRLALDRTFEERGLRLLFFRVGGLTVEMSASLKPADDPKRDALWGLAYRCADVDATQQRLREQGFAVSDVRSGFKPGTRVCTVHSPTHGVATLLIGPERP